MHNYGHGGSGWSLSWGSAESILPLALSTGSRTVAVIGCGAIGLTSAVALQRAGARVTIYARDLPPATRSARATGTWTPDARIALASQASPAFAAGWERMARSTFAAFGRLLHLPGRPIEMHDRYTLSDLPPDQAWASRVREDPIGFARLEGRLADLYTPAEDFGPGEHPFAPRFCRLTRGYRFNVAVYLRHLETLFRQAGGSLRQTEFHAPADILRLPEPVVVHCTGYGARTLFADNSLIPIRGQISWLPPLPHHPYSLICNDLNLVPRPDGTVVQWGAQGDGTGWQDAGELPDADETRSALAAATDLCTRSFRSCSR
ncbi:MAG: FAD-binding oxidoreductase [Rhodospirillales bacterium]|nr:FAD-binding oxidoreductase [Acetobacter sp.]